MEHQENTVLVGNAIDSSLVQVGENNELSSQSAFRSINQRSKAILNSDIKTKRRSSGAKIAKLVKGGSRSKSVTDCANSNLQRIHCRATINNNNSSTIVTPKLARIRKRNCSEKSTKNRKGDKNDGLRKSVRNIQTVIGCANLNSNYNSIRNYLTLSEDIKLNKHHRSVNAEPSSNGTTYVNTQEGQSRANTIAIKGPLCGSPLIKGSKSNTTKTKQTPKPIDCRITEYLKAISSHIDPDLSEPVAEQDQLNNMAENGSLTPAPSTAESIDESQIKYEKEIQSLKNAIAKSDDGSVQRMLLEIKLEMKIDNHETKKSLNTVISNTTLMQSELSQLQEENRIINTRIDQVQNLHDGEKTRVDTAIQDAQINKKKVDILLNLVNKQANSIKELKDQAIENECKSLRANLFISGIEEEEGEREQTTKELVTDFFTHMMKIGKKIPILSANRVGKGERRSIHVTLANAKDKSLIYKNGNNLKDRKNNNDESYYVNDQLPIARQEQMCGYKDILRKNYDLPVAEQFTMAIKKGKLLIGGAEYTPKVIVPTICDIVEATEREDITKIKLTTGSEVKNGRCRFIAMSQEVRSIQDVRKGYIKAKQLHSKALHVICVFRIPGEEFYSLQNYAEDEEWGMGRRLLQVMERNEIEFRAIFVARYYGGKRLGPSWFNSYHDAAKSAVACSSFNSLWNCNQLIQDRTQEFSKKRPNAPIRGSKHQTPVAGRSLHARKSNDDVWTDSTVSNPWHSVANPEDNHDSGYRLPPRAESGASAIQQSTNRQPGTVVNETNPT